MKALHHVTISRRARLPERASYRLRLRLGNGLNKNVGLFFFTVQHLRSVFIEELIGFRAREVAQNL